MDPQGWPVYAGRAISRHTAADGSCNCKAGQDRTAEVRPNMPKTVLGETRLYPVAIHREGDVWGYHSPEFGGGGAASHEDALSSALELLNSAVTDCSERGEDAPLPSLSDDVNADRGQAAWLPVVVSDVADRIAITLPRSLIARIDATTDNRSAFLAELARERLTQ